MNLEETIRRITGYFIVALISGSIGLCIALMDLAADGDTGLLSSIFVFGGLVSAMLMKDKLIMLIPIPLVIIEAMLEIIFPQIPFYLIIIVYLVIAAAVMLPLIFIALARYWGYKSELGKQLIIPEYVAADHEFYKIGLLVDGELSKRDLAASTVYHKLNPEIPRDAIAEELLRSLNSKAVVQEFTNTPRFKKGIFVTSYPDYIYRIYDLIYDQLVVEGLLRFNPLKFRRQSTQLGFGLLMLGIFIPPVYFASLFVFMLGNFSWVLALKQGPAAVQAGKLLGFKMFLETAEGHKMALRDEITLRDLGPYFIAFGLYPESSQSLIDKAFPESL